MPYKVKVSLGILEFAQNPGDQANSFGNEVFCWFTPPIFDRAPAIV